MRTLCLSLCHHLALVATALSLSAVPALADDSDRELAKTSQNPIGDIISLPFESKFDFNVGPEDALVYTLQAKPVYPIHLNDEVTLINRGIAPFIYQGERVADEGSEVGLGDFNYQGFFTARNPGPIIWGLGPTITVPTATDDRLGADKWSAGPAFVALAKPGPWLFGTLIQQSWSFAGDNDRDNVNSGSLQYFINYNFCNGTYLTSTPTIVADWDADSDDRFLVPFGGGIGRLFRFGDLPVDIKGQVFYNAEKPEGAATWSAQLQVKFLFPR